MGDPKPVSADTRTERGDRLRLEMCQHTKDTRRFNHGAPVKPKRYCDECIEDEIRAAKRAEYKRGWEEAIEKAAKAQCQDCRLNLPLSESGKSHVIEGTHFTDRRWCKGADIRALKAED